MPHEEPATAVPTLLKVLQGIVAKEGLDNPESLAESLTQVRKEPPKEGDLGSSQGGEPGFLDFLSGFGVSVGGRDQSLGESLSQVGIHTGSLGETPVTPGGPGGQFGPPTLMQQLQQGQQTQDPFLAQIQALAQGSIPQQQPNPIPAAAPPLPTPTGRAGGVGTPGVGGGFAPENVLPQTAAPAGEGGDILQALAALQSVTPAPPLPPPGTTRPGSSIQNILTPGLLAQLLQQNPQQQATLGQLIRGGI